MTTMHSVWRLLRANDQVYDASRHGVPRKDLLSLLRRPPRLVLDVGCKAGANAAELKALYPDVRVVGVESNPNLRRHCSRHCDEVFAGTPEAFLREALEAWPSNFDLVLLCDVLEHIADPLAYLEALRSRLADDAQLLVILPNFRNAWVLDDLAEGKAIYSASGICDISHLRFFTRREAEILFREAGYYVHELKRVTDPRAAGLTNYMEGGEASTPSLTIKRLDEEGMLDIQTLEFHFLLDRRSPELLEEECLSSGVKALLGDLSRTEDESESQNEFYHVWALQRNLKPPVRNRIEAMLATWRERESFALAAFVSDAQVEQLRETCFSLEAQLYPEWQFYAVSFETQPLWWGRFPQCVWCQLGDEDDSLEIINKIFASGTADWVGQLFPGDRMPPDALFKFAEAARRHPNWRWIYSDEDRFTTAQKRVNPLFKPDFSPDFLRSVNYVGGLSVVRRDLFVGVGGFMPEYEGVEDYELSLRLCSTVTGDVVGHVPEVLYHRHEFGRVSHLSPDELWDLGASALHSHLGSLQQPADVARGPVPHTWSVSYRLSTTPSVAIIIPTKDRLQDLRRCIDSVIRLTDYPSYEIVIIDNQSSEAETLAYLNDLVAKGVAKVIRYDAPFNFSAMNNLAAESVFSDYLLLLNNDTEVQSPRWLPSMLGFAEVGGAGVVGPLLVYQNGAVQHAGVVLGLGNMPAEHVYIGFNPQAPVVLDRLRLTQNYSAVTGACLLVRRDDYLAVGGLDAENLPRPFQDIDFCLKISTRLGKRIVWTPNVRLLHQGSVTFMAEQSKLPAKDVAEAELRGEPGSQYGAEVPAAEDEADSVTEEPSSAEIEYMYAKWGSLIATDPFYNRNLSLDQRASGIETEPMLSRTEWGNVPFLMASPNDRTGCGEYRIMAPTRVLLDSGKVEGGLTARIFGPSEIMRINPDVIVCQRQLAEHQVRALKRYKKRSSAFLVYDLDDLVTVGWNRRVKQSDRDEVKRLLRTGLGVCDRFIASTPRIADEYGQWCRETTIVPNYLPMDRWGNVSASRLGRQKPRIGWAGGSSHVADLEMISDVVKVLQHEVEWVFLGLCPEALRPFVHEYYEGVTIEGYPARLASLNLDLALAPLVDSDFNRARSSLRILEYGVLGYPVIASDMPSYRMGFPVSLVPDNPDDWVSAIREAISDRDALAAQGDRLQKHVQDHWIMDRNVDIWLKAWMP